MSRPQPVELYLSQQGSNSTAFKVISHEWFFGHAQPVKASRDHGALGPAR